MRTEEIEMPGQAISVTLPKECVDWVDKKVKTLIACMQNVIGTAALRNRKNRFWLKAIMHA